MSHRPAGLFVSLLLGVLPLTTAPAAVFADTTPGTLPFIQDWSNAVLDHGRRRLDRRAEHHRLPRRRARRPRNRTRRRCWPTRGHSGSTSIADQANPSAIATGGVAEFASAVPGGRPAGFGHRRRTPPRRHADHVRLRRRSPSPTTSATSTAVPTTPVPSRSPCSTASARPATSPTSPPGYVADASGRTSATAVRRWPAALPASRRRPAGRPGPRSSPTDCDPAPTSGSASTTSSSPARLVAAPAEPVASCPATLVTPAAGTPASADVSATDADSAIAVDRHHLAGRRRHHAHADGGPGTARSTSRARPRRAPTRSRSRSPPTTTRRRPPRCTIAVSACGRSR